MKKFIVFMVIVGMMIPCQSYAAKSASDKTPISAVSMNDSFNSATIQMGLLDRTSFHAVWTESVANLEGTLKIQVSTDCTNWDDLADMTTTLAGGSGSQLFILNTVSFKCLRFNFAHTAGEGTLTVLQRSINQ